MKTYKKILVIKSGALGDLIAGTTALKALRRAFPESHITLLSNPLMNEVCPPGILYNDVLSVDERESGIGKYVRLVRNIRRRRFDLAVNLRWSSEGSASLTLLSGAKERAGSGPRGVRWMYTVKAPQAEGRRHEFLRHLDIVEAIGITVGPPEPYVHFAEHDRESAAGFISGLTRAGDGVLLLHPGASTPSKAWPPANFIDLGVRFVQEFNGPVLITWGPGEEKLAGEVASGIGRNAHLGPRTTVALLAAIMKRSRICVCNYSGVMNVAMAVNTPLVALGCTSPEDWGPYGEMHRTVSAFTGHDSYTEESRSDAMRSIGVDEVWNVLSSRWRELALQHSVVGA